ncbi:MAG: hypothetical protein WCO33_04885 [bacterium]
MLSKNDFLQEISKYNVDMNNSTMKYPGAVIPKSNKDFIKSIDNSNFKLGFMIKKTLKRVAKRILMLFYFPLKRLGIKIVGRIDPDGLSQIYSINDMREEIAELSEQIYMLKKDMNK